MKNCAGGAPGSLNPMIKREARPPERFYTAEKAMREVSRAHDCAACRAAGEDLKCFDLYYCPGNR